MYPREVDFLIVGGGCASVSAAETLRLEGATGSILILSADSHLPYHRPALTKRYLRGEIDRIQILIHSEAFYQDHGIEVRLNTQVVAVDTAQQCVVTSTAETIHYGKLLLATGMTPKSLALPGASLGGIHYLRSLADCDAIRLSAAGAKRAVVLGGEFLGMEIALSFIEMGLSVTIVERGDCLLPSLGSRGLSDHFLQYAKESGVSVVVNDIASAFHGQDSVEAVETEAGTRLPCDIAFIATGVMPATGFLENSGIGLYEGLVVVNNLLATNDANIFAAGDITSFYDPIFARRRHIEHWDNAIKQGQVAAKNMLGQRVRYEEVSYFYSEVGNISFDMLGITDNADEWIERGSFEEKSFALFYLKGNILQGLFSLGRPTEETRAVEGLIRYKVNLGAAKKQLTNRTFALDHIRTQTILILQGGGAMGAFECGVIKALEEAHIFPDVVAGVSIGALNGAIVAGNPRHATAALNAFWADLTIHASRWSSVESRRASAQLSALMYGLPNFFTPRWLQPFSQSSGWPWNWTSYYDTAPMKELIAKYVDFSRLRESPVRLLISTVNVATAKLETFDSYVDELTPEHVLASGSLPPAFPWTMIDGHAYWDGGIVSNSPLDLVIERCGLEGKRVYIVDLYSDEKPLPDNMVDVMARRDEIVYSERIRNDLRLYEMIDAYQALVADVLSFVNPDDARTIKQAPRFIELMGGGMPVAITRFIRTNSEGDSACHDYDFSLDAIERNQAEGYALVKKTLAKPSSQTKHAVAARHKKLP